jgi:mannose-6-phosphate isomerase-like protein (cupin superfamily)
MGLALTSGIAEKNDTNGAFCLVEATLVPGNDLPPHVHSREDELFYVLEGAFDVYVGAEAFKVETGACIFLPKCTPHAFVIRSPRLRLLTLFTPVGLEEACRGLRTPAQHLELPTGALTYATADVRQTAQRLRAYGDASSGPRTRQTMPIEKNFRREPGRRTLTMASSATPTSMPLTTPSQRSKESSRQKE